MPELDEVELTLASWAIADGLPVLGICRGIQVLNVACEGTLWQDLNVEGATHEEHDREPRDLLVHGLDVEPGTLLARTLGETHLRVNSLHHQAIRDLGPSLRPWHIRPTAWWKAWSSPITSSCWASSAIPRS